MEDQAIDLGKLSNAQDSRYSVSIDTVFDTAIEKHKEFDSTPESKQKLIHGLKATAYSATATVLGVVAVSTAAFAVMEGMDMITGVVAFGSGAWAYLTGSRAVDHIKGYKNPEKFNRNEVKHEIQELTTPRRDDETGERRSITLKEFASEAINFCVSKLDKGENITAETKQQFKRSITARQNAL